MGKVAFRSQTWVSYEHPDPSGDKLKILQHLLRRAGTRGLVMEPHWYTSIQHNDVSVLFHCDFIWFEIFSVPQQNKEAQLAATSSIVSYVSDPSFFILLVDQQNI